METGDWHREKEKIFLLVPESDRKQWRRIMNEEIRQIESVRQEFTEKIKNNDFSDLERTCVQ